MSAGLSARQQLQAAAQPSTAAARCGCARHQLAAARQQPAQGLAAPPLLLLLAAQLAQQHAGQQAPPQLAPRPGAAPSAAAAAAHQHGSSCVQRWRLQRTAAAQGQPQQRARLRVVMVVLMLRVLLGCVPAPAASWTPSSGAAACSTLLQSWAAQQQLAVEMPGVCSQCAVVQTDKHCCAPQLISAACVKCML
jgi:hypothetical protein